MPILIKYPTIHIGLLRREKQTDLVTLNDDGTIGYYLATIDNPSNRIELHGASLPVTFDHSPTDLSDSEILP